MMNDKLKSDILAHADQCKPQESCGFVVFDGKKNRYIPCENLAADPIRYFEIAPEDFIAAEEAGKIVALVHSHPDSDDGFLVGLWWRDSGVSKCTAIAWTHF